MESEATTQVVEKTGPFEKTGVAVALDGKIHIIEYSDLPQELAERRDAGGGLAFWAGNIAVHIFDRSFLERMSKDDRNLGYHRAVKKVPYLNTTGKRITPDLPNALKFERFIFDILPAAKNSLVVEVRRNEAFAPIKISDGDDSAATAKQAIVDLSRRWLQSAGVFIEDEVDVEIDPIFALDSKELGKKIEPGIRIMSPTFFS